MTVSIDRLVWKKHQLFFSNYKQKSRELMKLQQTSWVCSSRWRSHTSTPTRQEKLELLGNNLEFSETEDNSFLSVHLSNKCSHKERNRQ
jgi:hypothetical protein